ncbi:MAG: hypothetical protein U1E76_03110 [Planctomycetota bacterium]
MGPFDEDYPFYFEDSDLSRRIRRAGKRCVLLPAAEMVHFYNKSAGQVYEQAMEKHGRSQRVYYRKHYGERGEQLAPRSTMRSRAMATCCAAGRSPT